MGGSIRNGKNQQGKREAKEENLPCLRKAHRQRERMGMGNREKGMAFFPQNGIERPAFSRLLCLRSIDELPVKPIRIHVYIMPEQVDVKLFLAGKSSNSADFCDFSKISRFCRFFLGGEAAGTDFFEKFGKMAK